MSLLDCVIAYNSLSKLAIPLPDDYDACNDIKKHSNERLSSIIPRILDMCTVETRYLEYLVDYQALKPMELLQVLIDLNVVSFEGRYVSDDYDLHVSLFRLCQDYYKGKVSPLKFLQDIKNYDFIDPIFIDPLIERA